MAAKKKTPKKPGSYCSFCGKTKNEVEKLYMGPSAAMCNECRDLTHEIDLDDSKESLGFQGIPEPLILYKEISREVIGQTRAKMDIARGVTAHYTRLKNMDDPKSKIELDKDNILVAGPTGCGKTLIATTLRKLLPDIPITLASATGMTEAGYVGKDVETVLSDLLERADGDVKKAERGIIYIDEADKLAADKGRGTNARDVGGKGVQDALLTMIEGAEISVPVKNAKKGQPQEVVINTHNILFICGGSFQGGGGDLGDGTGHLLASIVLQRLVKQGKLQGKSVGFGAKVDNERPRVKDLLAQVTPEDLQEFGMTPEFIGRLAIITNVEPLEIDDLERILTEPRNDRISQKKTHFASFASDNRPGGIKITFAPAALRAIAKQAHERKIGARGLRTILNKSTEHAEAYAPSSKTVVLVNITENVVTEGAEPEYFDADGNDASAEIHELVRTRDDLSTVHNEDADTEE